MDMLHTFHMNKGEGAESYAKNSQVQHKILSLTKPFIEEAIHGCLGTHFPETIAIADLGCSSGPNALSAASEIIDAVDDRRRQLGHRLSPKLMIYLNDLPGNDFNAVFVSLSNFKQKLKEEKGVSFGPCFIAGVPGSFYDRLLPSKSLHFVHSSSSLHWLSQVPPCLDDKDNPEMLNKGKIYLSPTSPIGVINAYVIQFRNDFLSFLKSRSEEVISGGRMVLTFMGRGSIDPTSEDGCYPWELIAQSLMTMVSEGLIEEDLVDNFNVPCYAPCVQELEQLINEEGSFSTHRMEAFEVEWDGGDISKEEKVAGAFTRGERVAKMHRAVVESMFQHQFGNDVMDELFLRYGRIVDDYLSKKGSKLINLVISLIRK